MKLEDLKVDDRVITTDVVENYPVINLEPGQLGIIASIGDGKDFVFVKLDNYHAELDAWNNEVQIWAVR